MSAIVASGMTRFGKRKEDLLSLGGESALPILRKYRSDIDFLLVSNSYSGEFNSISGINTLLATYLSLDGVPSLRVDNTSGSGGTAIFLADMLIKSGQARAVLVTGLEKMSTMDTRHVTSVIASLLPEEERRQGPSLPSLAALLAQLYMRRYGASRESLAQVSVKNHRNGAANPYAHIQKEVTLEEVMQSPVVAEPLRQYEFSPISDGAASVLVVGDGDAESFTDRPVYIKAVSLASDSASVTARGDLMGLEAVRRAGRNAMRLSGISKPDFAELHDMATVLELVQMESLGLCEPGEAWKMVLEGETEVGGSMPVNTSGGLNSKGHPIGASGVAQVVEAFSQIRKECGGRQVKDARTGLCLSMSGFGNSAAVTVLGDEP
ncbi:thiolase family protein [Thermogymnomonas acidicola]